MRGLLERKSLKDRDWSTVEAPLADSHNVPLQSLMIPFQLAAAARMQSCRGSPYY